MLTDAQLKLIETNQKLVPFVISKMYIPHGEYDDYFQEGMIALWQAVIYYDVTKGKFSVYAYKSIFTRLVWYYKKNTRKMKTVSLESKIRNNQYKDCFVMDVVQDKNAEFEKMIEWKLIIEEYVKKHAVKKNSNKYITQYINGLDQNTIAKRMGYSRELIGQTIRPFKKEMKLYLTINDKYDTI